MKFITSSETYNSNRFIPYPILFFFLFLLSMIAVSAEASVGGNVTFTWKANPVSENVIGYRLYYGAFSRFNDNGTSKTNFSYEYYIDFADQKRCREESYGTVCEILRPDEVQCHNLYEDAPQCTISNLQGDLYFALTAYSAQDESRYTSELDLLLNTRGVLTAQLVNSMLLLKNNK